VALTVVGGGSRSGKSRFALELAGQRGERLLLIATAEPGDDEMSLRIRRHREDRNPAIAVVEEPLRLNETISLRAREYDAVVIDCLTLWLSNQLARGAADEAILAETAHLANVALESASRVIAVTNEVGCGIVPENALARRFRDLAGWVNQKMVASAGEAWWMIFGCPLRLK